MELGFNDPVGKRIKYYRQKAGLTQKQLAEACGITEPAIRNYELGNRIPSYDTLDDIADALCVNFYALADPCVQVLPGALHILFRMEQAYGLSPVMNDGKLSLQINLDMPQSSPDIFEQMLMVWEKAHELVKNGTWTLEDYYTWQSLYPYKSNASLEHPLSIALHQAMQLPDVVSTKPDAPKKRKRKPKEV